MPKKIFIVSDNKQVEGLLFNSFYKLGYLVKIYAAAEGFADAVRQYAPDLVLCDAALAGAAPVDLVRQFRGHPEFHKTPLVMIVADAAARAAWEQRGPISAPNDFLTFPPAAQAVYDVANRWLENVPEEPPPAPVAAPPKKVIEAKISGAVDCRTIGRLLFELLETRAAGELTVQSESHYLKATFRDALLVEVGSDYIWEDTFASYLIRIKRITAAQHQTTLQRAHQWNVLHGEALVRSQIITDAERRQFLQHQKTLKFLRLFQGPWSGANFEFSPGPCEMSPFMTPAPLRALLKDGFFNLAPADALARAFFPPERRRAPIVRADDFLIVCRLLELTPPDVEPIERLWGNTIEEMLASQREISSRLLRLVCLLRVGGAIKMIKPLEIRRPPTAPVEHPPVVAAPPAEAAVAGSGPRTVHPPGPEALVVEARRRFERGDFAEAAPLLREAIDANPKSADALAMLAWIRFDSGAKNDAAETGRCKELLRRALRFDPANARVFLFLGKIFKHENRFAEARSHLQRANLLEPNNIEIMAELAALDMAPNPRTPA